MKDNRSRIEERLKSGRNEIVNWVNVVPKRYIIFELNGDQENRSSKD